MRAQIRDEWQRYREGCAEAHDISAPIDLLEEAYSWADRLATHFAQTYRSGHIFNFVLGGLAVCLGLSAFMAPHLKFEFAALEMLITLAIILNAICRQAPGMASPLARLSPARRAAAADAQPQAARNRGARPAGDPDQSRAEALDRLVCERNLARDGLPVGKPRLGTARRGSPRRSRIMKSRRRSPITSAMRVQIELLDRRLEEIGTMLFVATLLVSVATLIGLALGADFVNRYGNWFTLVSAGFPALGTAVFGIRFQADFGGDALRSMATADTLGEIDRELRKDVSLSRAADLTEQAARFMLSDLDEWRLVNQQRDLSVG